MFDLVEGLLDLLQVLGTSKWGWLGLALGAGTAFLCWQLLSESSARGPVSALAFVVTFALCVWQELRDDEQK